ncbi:hypothetical protein [Actinomadura macrotermitis]|uniref:Uncharacterized protein n=1 Tax=Actinomadura macrotermitis TaxID=2585200 RepID=A0A7K0C9L3_9ACTN|nr:hypothetical protein [Actinomadura macrotermitis]MQY09464.1 hypothetical protein [Actinomadura macrotermitis]
MPTATVLAAVVLLGLLTLLAARRRPRTGAVPGPAAATPHPESLTAVLAAGEEEYLACLADELWPADEYLDLEQQWLYEDDLPDPHTLPACPQCLLRREDVWPCPRCGRLLHSSCGHGMHRRSVDRPYRAAGMGPEDVTAEWRCTGCTELVGLDVEQGDDDLLH